MNELEILDMPWFNVKEGVQRLRKIGMLEWVCHLAPTHPNWEGPEDIPFTNAVRHKFVRGATASLMSSVITLLCKPGLKVGTAVPELGNLNAVGIIGSPSGRDQVVALNHQRQCGHGYHNGQQLK